MGKQILKLHGIVLLLCLSLLVCRTEAQNVVRIKVVDAATSESLPGASVVFATLKRGASANADGNVEFKDIPQGRHELKISYVGYMDTVVMIDVPTTMAEVLVGMHASEGELEEIIVSSTRTNRRIEDLPLKVEVLGMEEMDEESALVPGNIASILGDLAVITVQRTNPVNGNDAIRMQGLDQQYTLLAKDGLPLFGGFSGSLGVLSIPLYGPAPVGVWLAPPIPAMI